VPIKIALTNGMIRLRFGSLLRDRVRELCAEKEDLGGIINPDQQHHE